MTRRRIDIDGLSMAYAEIGEGDPIVFLHGNPTSSYLWRNIMPELAGLGRCIAPDLIGMGASDKLPESGPGAYRFVDQSRWLDAFIERMALGGNVTLVIHDWGSALGFHWAARHADAVRAIAYMEAIVEPMAWDDLPPGDVPVFKAFRGPEGEKMVLSDNVFIEEVLPADVLRDLSDDEMAAYRAPFQAAGEGRRPMLTWPRELPFDGEPADVVAAVEAYGAFMANAEMPKLFINAEPGSILTGRHRDFCRTWPNQTEVTVPGIHYIQEDSSPEIAAALVAWLKPQLRP
ncbi:MAG: haloalkane dehalogenase [Pseudomonadota bacterium]